MAKQISINTLISKLESNYEKVNSFFGYAIIRYFWISNILLYTITGICLILRMFKII